MCPFLQTGQLSSACDWFYCIHWIFSACSCLFVTTAVQVTYIESGFHSQLTVRHGFSLVRYLTHCSLGSHSGWWPERASWWTCTLCYWALWPSMAWRVRHSSKIPSGLQVLEETFWVSVIPFHLCAFFLLCSASLTTCRIEQKDLVLLGRDKRHWTFDRTRGRPNDNGAVFLASCQKFSSSLCPFFCKREPTSPSVNPNSTSDDAIVWTILCLSACHCRGWIALFAMFVP